MGRTMVGPESEQNARRSKSNTVAVAQGIDKQIETLKIGQKTAANARTAYEYERKFRGTNSSGNVVDITVGTVMHVYDSLEQAVSAREAIQSDIALHTNDRVIFKTAGRVRGQKCIRCYCVLNRRVVDFTVRRRSPKTPEQQQSRKVISSFTGSKRKRSRRPGVRRLHNQCKAHLFVAIERKHCKYLCDS